MRKEPLLGKGVADHWSDDRQAFRRIVQGAESIAMGYDTVEHVLDGIASRAASAQPDRALRYSLAWRR